MTLDETEITEGLKEEGVVATRKIKKWKDWNSVLIDTPIVILTFKSPVIPEAIKVGYLNVKTELYIPNPLRCTMCQKFGHGKKRCAELNELPKCGMCAALLTPEDKSHQPCKNPPKCVNCGEGHGSFSRECRIFRAESEITKIKTVDRVSFRIARQKYAELTRSQKPKMTLEPTAVAAAANAPDKTVSSDSLSKIIQITNTNSNSQIKTSPTKQIIQ